MFSIFPPSVDIDNSMTQVKYETIQEFTTSSTCLESSFQAFPDDDSIIHWDKLNSITTNVELDIDEKKISTWEEINTDDFDITAKLYFKNSYKIKSRITKVSKYTPNIIID